MKLNIIGVTFMISLLSACSRGKEDLPSVVSYDKWADPIHTYEKIDDAYDETVDSVIISGGTHLLANQNLLFIEDYNSTEKIFHVINIPEKRYIGAFGNYGEGPAEILRPGSIFTLCDSQLAVFDYGHWSVKAFDVDSALACSNYVPQTLVSLSENNGSSGFPDRFVYVHNDRGIARMIMPKDNSGYSQELCTFNIKNGATEPFGEQKPRRIQIFSSSVIPRQHRCGSFFYSGCYSHI